MLILAQKYYVVWQGRETGIFNDWGTCKKQIDHYPGAKYKSFKTLNEAQSAFTGGHQEASANKSVKTIKKTGLKTYTAHDIAGLSQNTKIYTDGGCEPNPGEAGSGMAVYRNEELSELWYGLYNPKGTNNTAELNALHQALILANEELNNKRSVAIFCDSKYAIQCVTQWAVGWEKKGWKKAGGEIKNLELIQQMFALYQTLKNNIEVLHVNGHVGVEGNELADRMSIMAIETAETDFQLYRDDIDIPAILATRAG